MSSKERAQTMERVRRVIDVQLATGKKIDVQTFIVQHMVNDGNGSVWVHTHGMSELFDLPDLEIKDVFPAFLAPRAAEYLNHLAQYMIDGKFGVEEARPYKLGESFGPLPGDFTITTEVALPTTIDDIENEEHYSNPRWKVVLHRGPPCAGCGKYHEPKKGEKQHVH